MSKTVQDRRQLARESGYQLEKRHQLEKSGHQKVYHQLEKLDTLENFRGPYVAFIFSRWDRHILLKQKLPKHLFSQSISALFSFLAFALALSKRDPYMLLYSQDLTGEISKQANDVSSVLSDAFNDFGKGSRKKKFFS